MKITFSLKQSWTIIILIAVLTPSVSLMIWYNKSIYKNYLSSSIAKKSQTNELIFNKINSKFRSIIHTIRNRVKYITPLVEDMDNEENIKQLNLFLKSINQSRHEIKKVILVSPDLGEISSIDTEFQVINKHLSLLNISSIDSALSDSNLDFHINLSEIKSKLMAGKYVSRPEFQPSLNGYTFNILTSIGNPVKAILIAIVDINEIWMDEYKEKKCIDSIICRSYLLDSHGLLITEINGGKYKLGDELENMELHYSLHTKTKKINNLPHIGALHIPVYSITKVIPILDWWLITEVTALEISQPILDDLLIFMLCTILFLLIFIKFILTMVGKTLKPIQDVSSAMGQISNKDYQLSLSPTRIIELELMNIDMLNMSNALKKSEQELEDKYLLQTKEKEHREILDSMVIAVMTMNKKGVILSFNKAAEDLFGYKFKEVVNKNIKILMPESDAVEHNPHIENHPNVEKLHIEDDGREVIGKNKNNRLFPMRILVAKLPRNINGEKRFIGSCIDLTDAKQREEQLQRSQKMDALRKITGGLSHDFNNMLGVILGYTQLLNMSLVKLNHTKLISYVSEIQKAGERGANLTKKLLSFSQKKSSKAELIDVNTMLLGERDLLIKTLTVRVKLAFHLCDNIWPIYADKNELLDSILNVVINAMFAMKDMHSDSQLTICTNNRTVNQASANKLELKTGDYVVISFLDNGAGIDDSIKKRIFDPFFTSKGNKGSGLGLSQVFGFIKQSGGSVEVNSKINKGSQFVFYFPRSSHAKSELLTNTKKSEIDYKGFETILIVDDENALVELTAEILQNQGYYTYTANTAKKAIEILNNKPVDLMITDIIMPEMDGYQLTSTVQKKYPRIKIQLVSGFNDEYNLGLINLSLAQKLIHKPINSQVLLKNIRDLLDSKNNSTLVKIKNKQLEERRNISLLVWEDRFNTGVSDIDKDHENLLIIINMCINILNGNNHYEEVKETIFKRLLNSSENHFKKEEEILEASDYPHLHKHKMVHQLFIQRIKHFKNEFQNSALKINSLLDFLLDWQKFHIMIMDKEALSYALKEPDTI